jgi:hypothetical protein
MPKVQLAETRRCARWCIPNAVLLRKRLGGSFA